MEEQFPETVFLSQCGEGEDKWLSASKIEVEAVKATEDGENAKVAEYRLVSLRDRRLVTTVEDAELSLRLKARGAA
jgi:hypothetical protein